MTSTAESSIEATLGNIALRQDQVGETLALNGLGEALLAHGRPKDAHAQHAAALSLARKTGDRYQLARAHAGLGSALLAAGDHRRSRQHHRLVLSHYTQLGAPEADQLRARQFV